MATQSKKQRKNEMAKLRRGRTRFATSDRDYIIGFTKDDYIDSLSFDGRVTLGVLPEFQLALGDAATTEEYCFIYNSATGALDADGTGPAAQIQFAQLTHSFITPFNVVINGEESNQAITGYRNLDSDYIEGTRRRDYLEGTEGNDVIFGGKGNDTLLGRDGIDGLYGDSGNDRLYGGDSIDFLYGAAGNDYLNGGSGDDFLADDAGNDVMYGGEGNDFHDPGPGRDRVWGGAGDDFLTGGVGQDNDELYGGEGKDVFNFLAPNQGIDTIGDFEVAEDIILVNSMGFGGGIMPGVLPEFQLALGDAATTKEHRFIYNSATGALSFDADGTGPAAQIQFAQLTHSFITPFNIVINGEESNQAITGYRNLDSDYIEGTRRRDYLEGTEGNDVIFGGKGNDTLLGKDGIDGLYGDSGNDKLYGGDSIDFLYGAAGNDYLNGGSGDDFLADDAGNDVMYGGEGNDFHDPGPGRDRVWGGAGDDILTGGVGQDRDILFGGPGQDIFNFVELAQSQDRFAWEQGVDIIGDFAPTDDTISVNPFGFEGGLSSGVLPESQFTIGNTATTKEHHFIYNSATGALSFDADGTGVAPQVQFAQLTDNLALSASNILVTF